MWLRFLQSFFGLMSVCFGESKSLSRKECKIVKKRPYHLLANVIDCTHKGFKTIPKDVFNVKNVKYIKLGHNPYVCDCNLAWFVQETLKKKLLDAPDVKCAEPAELKDKFIKYLTVRSLCKSKKVFNSYKDCAKMKFFNGLDCSGLGLKSIPLDIFRAPFKLIFLAGNRYSCNCRMKWFIRRLRFKDFKQDIRDKASMKCIDPPRLAGKFISKLTEDDVCPKDIDVCATNIHDCHEDAICKYHRGGYSCNCKDGFSGDGKVCVDIDECADKIADCSKDATCQNNVGNFRCICKAGYNEYHNGKICEKEEVNSCYSDPSPCTGANEICIYNREVRSFKCVCRKGFARKSRVDGCDDINECTTTKPCAVNAMCKNTFGSYECSCKKGFSGNGKYCVDIDECTTAKHKCHLDAVCTNNIGGYKCQCKPGFKQFKNGMLCLKELKGAKGSSMSIFAVTLPILFLTLVVLGILLYTSYRKRQKPSSGEEKLISNPPSEKLQEKMFIFDVSLTDLTMQKILPSESAITEWSEYEESEEDQTDSE